MRTVTNAWCVCHSVAYSPCNDDLLNTHQQPVVNLSLDFACSSVWRKNVENGATLCSLGRFLFIALAEPNTWQELDVCQGKMCTAWPAVSKCIKTNYKYWAYQPLKARKSVTVLGKGFFCSSALAHLKENKGSLCTETAIPGCLSLFMAPLVQTDWWQVKNDIVGLTFSCSFILRKHSWECSSPWLTSARVDPPV